jgi:hypothetical protein
MVLGLGTLDLYQHYRLSLGASVALSLARALPLVVCLARPLAGWWLELAASALTALVADPVSSAEPWPWPITSVFALVVVLVIVGLRAPRRVLVELWLLLALLSVAAWLAVPDRRDWRGLSTMVVGSAIALLLADAWRERSETGAGSPRRSTSARPSAAGAWCWRSARGSPGSCTTSSPITCR